MKCFDTDWTDVFRLLPAWEQLSPRERQVILDVPPRAAADVAPYCDEEAIEAGCAMGLLETFREGQRVRATEAGRGALVALRAMGRFNVSEAPGPTYLREYLSSMLTRDERERLYTKSPDDLWRHYDGRVEALITNPGYLQAFLDSKSPAAWLNSHEDALPGSEITAAAARDVAKLLKRLMARPDAPFLQELAVDRQGLSRARLSAALRTALRHAFVFADTDGELRPRVAIHPAIRARLHRPKITRPGPVDPDTCTTPVPVVDDLVCLLVFLSEPRRIRANDNALFAKSHKELIALLPPENPDVEALYFADHTSKRISRARYSAREDQLIVALGEGTKNKRLEVTEEGRAWLGQSRREQVLSLIESHREGIRTQDETWLYRTFSWTFPRLGAPLAELIASFAHLDQPRNWAHFVAWQKLTENPLFERDDLPTRSTPEQLENAWGDAMLCLLERVLIPFGGVMLGQAGDSFNVGLTDIGRYMLGFTDELALAEAPAESAVLVQPDFEVIFLAPDAQLEAELAPFAERLGKGVGALFRFTQGSVRAGARAGLPIERLVERLEATSQAPLPANVKTELLAWHSSAVSLDWQRPFVISCPDEATALRVLDAAGRYLERAGETLLVLRDSKKRAQVTKACAKLGIFLGAPPDEPAPKKRKKRRSNWSRW